MINITKVEGNFSLKDEGSFILASSSLTRSKLLKSAGLEHHLMPANIDEQTVRKSAELRLIPAKEIALILANEKSKSVFNKIKSQFKNPLVLGCDQILFCKKTIFEKPSSFNQAREQLLALSGKTHQLFTAATLYKDGKCIWSFVAKARMTMRKLEEEFIENYLMIIGKKAFDSPGSYQVESIGVQLFTRIDGCYYGILGLPLIQLFDFLRQKALMKE